jgi:hypothetical protein
MSSVIQIHRKSVSDFQYARSANQNAGAAPIRSAILIGAPHPLEYSDWRSAARTLYVEGTCMEVPPAFHFTVSRVTGIKGGKRKGRGGGRRRF